MFEARPRARRVWLARHPLGRRAGPPAWRARASLRSCRKSGQEPGSEGHFPAGVHPLRGATVGAGGWSGHGAKRGRLGWNIGEYAAALAVLGRWDGCPRSHGLPGRGDAQRPGGDPGPGGEASRLGVRVLGRGSRRETGTAGARRREEATTWLG